MSQAKVLRGEDDTLRCWWCGNDALYVAYHDDEWGRPIRDESRLFEKICLEGFQSGLSWLTILRKRENFRRAFRQFSIEKVARFNQSSVQRMLKDAGIVRHRGKIESAINNAKRAIELKAEFGSLAAYFWTFEAQTQPPWRNEIRSISEESTALSKDLKNRGWSFIGPTTCYAFMQAMGMVNDHHPDCASYEVVDRLRAQFKRPKAKLVGRIKERSDAAPATNPQ